MTSKGTFVVTDRMGMTLSRREIVAQTRFEATRVRNDLLRQARTDFPDAMYFTEWKEGS